MDSNCVSKIFILLYKKLQFLKFLHKKMVIIEIFLMTKFDQNIHQNAPNCTILKNFLGEGGACP